MQEQEVEVSFCDLCGTSVPAGDIDSRVAVAHQGKTIGGCCLQALRTVTGGDAAAVGGLAGGQDAASTAGGGPVTSPAAAPSGAAGGGSGGSQDSGRLLTVAVVLLAALAGGVIFLDSRISRLENAMTKSQGEVASRQKADSDALMGMSVRIDGLAQSGDLSGVATKTDALKQVVNQLQKDAGDRHTVLEQEVGVLRSQLRATSEQIVDYRPLFQDLRERHTRAMAVIEGMRSEVAAVPASVTPDPRSGDDEPRQPLDDIPADLAEQVRKLVAADPAVRFEAVDVLIESRNLKILPHLLPLAKDPDAFVRRLTVEGLREFRKPEAVDALIQALGDGDENVCDTAWRSLRDVTGQKFRFEASANKEARGRAAQAWQDWWEKARPTFGS